MGDLHEDRHRPSSRPCAIRRPDAVDEPLPRGAVTEECFEHAVLRVEAWIENHYVLPPFPTFI